MPPSALSIVARWLLSHLVVFTLSGYLITGLCVFGVIRCPVDGLQQAGHQRPAATAARPATEARDTGGVAPWEGPSGRTAADAAHKPEKPVRKAPRLIGGSIPVYGIDGETPAAADGFRPSPAEPLGAAEPISRDKFLQHARRAFWNGDFEGAEAGYIGMIARYPGDADPFGELGNLYQAMGRPAQARDAYFEAGIRLKLAGETDRLQQVIDILIKEGDDRVDQLRP